MAYNGWECKLRRDRTAWSTKELRTFLDLHSTGDVSQYNRSATKATLLNRISRIERCMPSYINRSIEELLSFIANRNLSNNKLLKKSRKSELIKILEDADDEMTFRFLDLPSELRVCIHEFHIASLGSNASIFKEPPPITSVSRIIRKESLPVFYGTQTLDFSFATPKETMKSRRLFERAPLSIIESIRSFQLRGRITRHMSTAVIYWKVDASKKGSPCKVTEQHLKLEHHVPAYLISRANERMREFVKQREKKGRFKLQRGDWMTLTNIVLILAGREHRRLS